MFQLIFNDKLASAFLWKEQHVRLTQNSDQKFEYVYFTAWDFDFLEITLTERTRYLFLVQYVL
jgi:hypothetical protein